jgi:hypothetical protein
MAAQDVYVLLSELKGYGLEIQVARRIGQEEAKVDVNHMPLRVEQDVSVMSVLYLKDVAEERIAGH